MTTIVERNRVVLESDVEAGRVTSPAAKKPLPCFLCIKSVPVDMELSAKGTDDVNNHVRIQSDLQQSNVALAEGKWCLTVFLSTYIVFVILCLIIVLPFIALDILRTFLASINLILEGIGGFGIAFDSIDPPEGLDVFTVLFNATNGTDVIELNTFLVYVQNGNLLTLLGGACLLSPLALGFIVYKCGFCKRATWSYAFESVTSDDSPESACYCDGVYGILLVFCTFAAFTIVWFVPIDMVQILELQEWLYLPGNETLANFLAYVALVVISMPCWLCCCTMCCYGQRLYEHVVSALFDEDYEDEEAPKASSQL